VIDDECCQVTLEVAVARIATGHLDGALATETGEDLEQVAHAGLRLPVESNLVVSVGDRLLDLLVDVVRGVVTKIEPSGLEIDLDIFLVGSWRSITLAATLAAPQPVRRMSRRSDY